MSVISVIVPMPQPKLAPILLAPFRERFLKDGNVYDVYSQSRFSVEEKEALIKKNPILTNTKCYDFAKKAYARNPNEISFRAYIGVNAHDRVPAVKEVHSTSCASKPEGEFDVVRKRRLMEEAEARGDGGSHDDSPEALANFEEFEAATLAALLEIHEDEVNNYSREAIEMEEAGIAYGTTGGVYFAATEALPGYIKIGCTRRHDPMVRLGELSRYVG